MTIATTRYVTKDGDPFDLLPEGARIRSIQHPELLGYIKHYEWHSPGNISPIPYFVVWDDPDAAREILGWFQHFASPSGIEAAP